MSALGHEFSRESFDLPESGPSSEEMHQLMVDKAHELFKVCDIEEKGFITKRDMQRLQSELPLSPDQLEHVFDSLDDDGNGFLTLEEFTDGFGSFLGISSGEEKSEMDTDKTYTDEQDVDPAEEEQNFKQMMKNVGATNLFDDESTIQGLWCRLKRDDPDMAGHFEDFVYRISGEIKKSKSDFDTLEGALRSKTTAHDEEVRKLYEEMEVQIKQEKEKILNEEKAKERHLREAMEQEIYEKDKQLQELVSKHAEMEEKLGYLNTIETETKIENEKLAKEKDDLEDMLLKSQGSLEESQSYINQLQQQQKDDKRERAKAAIKLSEGIAVERETLVKQLDILKNMNRKLQDEKDEADIRRDISLHNTSLEREMEDQSPQRDSPRRGQLERQGSSLSKYFDSKRVPKLPSHSESISEEDLEKMQAGGLTSGLTGGLTDIDDGIECDDDMYIEGQTPMFIHHSVDSLHRTRAVPQSPWKQNLGKQADSTDSDLDSLDGSRDQKASPNDASELSSAEQTRYRETSPTRRHLDQILHTSAAPLSPMGQTSASVTGPTLQSAREQNQFRETSPTRKHLDQTLHTTSAAPLSSMGQTSASVTGPTLQSSTEQTRYRETSPTRRHLDQTLHTTSAAPLGQTSASFTGPTLRTAREQNHYRETSPTRRQLDQTLHKTSAAPLSSTEQSSLRVTGPTLRTAREPSSQSSAEPTHYRASSPTSRHLDQVVHTASAVTSFAKVTESGSSSYSPDSSRVQPVGADGQTDSGTQGSLERAPLQRVFKVVFVGDSGVGKSSFIHRFCTNHFKSSYAATIGVDFQIKNLNIEGQIIVLQLWDTAGQERFRSITKQYFRKADGVIIMYDVTSETSFTNVRNWMTSVQDGASDEAIVVLLGNKNDLPEDDETKAVKMKTGSRLADEYGALFYETSALSGDNVSNSMEALARVLKEKEDKEIEKSFHLEDVQAKKGCCS